jgi:hypothetical protein
MELDLRMQHQHADGSWGTLVSREPHSPSELDPERGWADGRLYACTTCDELVRVKPGDEEPPPD